MQKITVCLGFDDQAEEAVKFYTSIFKNSKVLAINRYGDAGAKAAGRPKGSVMTVAFELEGQQYLAINGGPMFKFSMATSLIVNCEDQREVDYYWEKLSAGGQAQACGWLTDQFGLSWQITPRILSETMLTKDEATQERIFAAMLKMSKLDVATLKKAAEG